MGDVSPRWLTTIAVVLVGCGDPWPPTCVRCNADGIREMCGADGSWTATDFVCTTNIAIDDVVGSICATKADGRARCWNADGTTVGDLGLPDANYKRVQAARVGTIGLTRDGRLLGASRGEIPADLPPIADFRATDLGAAGLCLIAHDGSLLYGNYLPEVDPPLTLAVEAGPFADVACAFEGLVAGVRSDGTVWGTDLLPGDSWARIAISTTVVCGLSRAGEVTCSHGPAGWAPGVPMFTRGPYRQVAASFQAACALEEGGALTCLRSADGEGLTIDPGQFTFIVAGRDLVCGIRLDGTSACFRQEGIADHVVDYDYTFTKLSPITPPLDADW